MMNDDYNYVQWRSRFQDLGDWFNKRDTVDEWLAEYDATAAELSAQIQEVVGDETFAVLERNTVAFGSYYIYGVTAGPGEIIFSDLKLNHTEITPEDTWANVVDLESLATVDADHIIFTSDDGTLGELEDNPVWQNLKAVKMEMSIWVVMRLSIISPIHLKENLCICSCSLMPFEPHQYPRCKLNS